MVADEAVDRGLEMEGAGIGVHVEPINATLVDSERGGAMC